MANNSSNNALHPTGKPVRRSYLPRSTPKVQFLPPEEVIKLMSRKRARCHGTNGNQTRKGHQKRIQKLKPPVDRSAGSKSSLLKPNPKTSSNCRGASVVPQKKPEFGVSKKKGQEKAPAHKRKSAHEDAPKKLTIHAEVESCNP